ncbi:MAG: hypothetical protein LBP65_02225 [Puniceicoccales bacterium]|nr:hypothetical protein [Puniceicoccales bacterium]
MAPSFHCKEFIHPKIEKLNRANTQEGKLKAFLWDILGNQEFTGHSTDLHNRILGECGENGMKYAYYCVNQLGVLLSKLCKIYADEFILNKRHGEGKPTYTIRLKGEDLP